MINIIRGSLVCFIMCLFFLPGGELCAQEGKQVGANVGFDFIVAKDGSGTHASVQEAINAVPDGWARRSFIYIKNGVYKELINIPKTKSKIALIGENKLETIITYDNWAGKQKPGGGTYGTTGSTSIFIYGTDFYAKNITFENSADESQFNNSGTQAVAIRTDGDRFVFKNCRFIGNQDTLYVRNGRAYFYDCYVEGDVDFVFGDGPAVLENCEIRSLDRPDKQTKGYITAPSTLAESHFGIVFIGCKITADPAVGKSAVFLGRAWHPSSYSKPVSANGAFLYCELGEHLYPQGWTIMDSYYPITTERFYEYKNTGPGAASPDETNRRQLTDEQAALYTAKNILKGNDDWDPAAPVEIPVLTETRTTAQVVLPKYYVVRLIPENSDCLWNIAAYPFVYNDPNMWEILYNANKNIFPVPGNPNLILPGLILEIPPIAGEKREGTYEPGKTYPPSPAK